MSCCQCQGIELFFNDWMARRVRKHYRKHGNEKTTRKMLAAIKQEGVTDMTLLDIGGGIGGIQLDLLAAGASEALSVDASSAFMAIAEQEAREHGMADRIRYQFGDFAELAPNIGMFDIVTLDRVICCYDDMPALVQASAERAGKYYGAVYLRDAWWVIMVLPIINLIPKIMRKPFRAYVHSTTEVDRIIRATGMTPHYQARTFIWQVFVYKR